MITPFRTLTILFSFFLSIGLLACGEDSTSTASDENTNENSEDSAIKDDEDHDDDDKNEDGKNDEDHDEDDKNEDDKKSGLSSHEHGAAELSVAWSGNDMVIDLISPTDNIFGFENEAATDEEKSIVEDRTEAMSNPSIIEINTEADCQLSGETTTELEYEGSHSEITASWEFVCENPDDITQLDATQLFSEFPNIEDLDVQWASPTSQSAVELTPESTIVTFN